MIETIESWDQKLLLAINAGHNAVLDELMWFFSQKLVWIPLYLLLFLLFVYQYGWKQSLIWILPAAAILIALSDQGSVHLFKRVFERYRPCHNLDLQAQIHLVNNYCGGKFGFISSHASNTFALAFFVSAISKWKTLTWLIFIWAAIVSYSRIYLGVHYPADIIGGAIFGMLVGFVLTKFLKTRIKYIN